MHGQTGTSCKFVKILGPFKMSSTKDSVTWYFAGKLHQGHGYPSNDRISSGYCMPILIFNYRLGKWRATWASLKNDDVNSITSMMDSLFPTSNMNTTDYPSGKLTDVLKEMLTREDMARAASARMTGEH